MKDYFEQLKYTFKCISIIIFGLLICIAIVVFCFWLMTTLIALFKFIGGVIGLIIVMFIVFNIVYICDKFTR